MIEFWFIGMVYQNQIEYIRMMVEALHRGHTEYHAKMSPMLLRKVDQYDELLIILWRASPCKSAWVLAYNDMRGRWASKYALLHWQTYKSQMRCEPYICQMYI